ncbi:MAG: NAD/FAD-binding protein, partial [Beijerinckiaceae bacterium]
DEKTVLGAFQYACNETYLHTDTRLMPKRRAAWASWNYLSKINSGESALTATYWMNRLQRLETETPVLVTLNPPSPPHTDSILGHYTYEHPQFDMKAFAAQKRLWSLQGQQCTWFCGAHFGAGFHEDGLQAGLAVAETLGGVRRPWNVANESGRIYALNIESAANAGGNI